MSMNQPEEGKAPPKKSLMHSLVANAATVLLSIGGSVVAGGVSFLWGAAVLTGVFVFLIARDYGVPDTTRFSSGGRALRTASRSRPLALWLGAVTTAALILAYDQIQSPDSAAYSITSPKSGDHVRGVQVVQGTCSRTTGQRLKLVLSLGNYFPQTGEIDCPVDGRWGQEVDFGEQPSSPLVFLTNNTPDAFKCWEEYLLERDQLCGSHPTEVGPGQGTGGSGVDPAHWPSGASRIGVPVRVNVP